MPARQTPLHWLNTLDAAAAADPGTAPLAKIPLDDFLALQHSASSLLRDDLSEDELEERHHAAAMVLTRFPAAIANYRLLLQQAAAAVDAEDTDSTIAAIAAPATTAAPAPRTAGVPQTPIASIRRRGNSLEWIGTPPRRAALNLEIARENPDSAPGLQFVEHLGRCEITVRIEPSGRRNFVVAVSLSWIAPDIEPATLVIQLLNPTAGLRQSHPWTGQTTAFDSIQPGQVTIQVLTGVPQGTPRSIAEIVINLETGSR
jgi:hypothetical protein